ncbi:hypothetical protein DBT_0007 [Dissulfuribacter thermophilus]|uniref:Uncharacterized protein n=1 Tax=Dissulfuribacter thermophilus TaxID=1156395 RepID=A0A1B9F8G2_9BACT|nr:hypothetical protein [Dissulfuribacter thermophilus]OCC16190.1 hypothetical protein DBT_0007 [Dissulfuribacter thermophilus]
MKLKRMMMFIFAVFLLGLYSQSMAYASSIEVKSIDLKGGLNRAYLSRGIQEILLSRLSSAGIRAYKAEKTSSETEYSLTGYLKKVGNKELLVHLVLRRLGKKDAEAVEREFERKVESEDGLITAIDELSKDIVGYLETDRDYLSQGPIPPGPSQKQVETRPMELSSQLHVEKRGRPSEMEIELSPDLPPEDEKNLRESEGIFSLFKWRDKAKAKDVEGLPAYTSNLPVPTPEELMALEQHREKETKKAKKEFEKKETEFSRQDLGHLSGEQAKVEQPDERGKRLPTWKWF